MKNHNPHHSQSHGAEAQKAERQQGSHQQHEDAAGFTDPVCGMTVAAGARHRTTHEGRDYRFCSSGRLARFQADPKRFLGLRGVASAATQQAAVVDAYTCRMHPEVRETRPGNCPKCSMALELAGPSPASTRPEWTCPMHPEIVRDAPGNCPICGMALEPRAIQVEEGASAELKDMTRRFWFATVLTVPLVLLVMGDMLLGHPTSALMSMRTRVLIELALVTPVCTWSAWPFYVRAVQSVKNRSLNMFTLIGLGVSVAYVYSVVGALLPDIFPASFREESGQIGVYFEAAGVS